ncbi:MULTISPECIES: IPExxxVDY family protein [unclassified Arenibacter]|uniref:IPExxxVDY family protein n=1 Tax=unclassified Arenibacter TaxID=2615047 RepID=UPI000E344094|nr:MULTISPECIES: IPExxxVDY family protein [unclassified Arenibacter]MCM4164069.1 IPExxxVDY family protein [Arenibacter sp. A80]RFT56763.1 IPExxxVDY family protein [Arenibacter sp. P308M17]
MAAIHRISEDFYEESFTLIALHSSIEDFMLVYALNSCLKTKLKRSVNDLDLSQNGTFPIFDWRDEVNDRYYTFVSNNDVKEEEGSIGNLFQDQPTFTKYHLVPEYRDVDYFLKIEHDELDVEGNILKSVLTIPKVITAYLVDASKLKSKNNLIF